VTSNGAIRCWGNNAFRQSEPLTGKFTWVTAGAAHTCALRTDNTVECWGVDSGDPFLDALFDSGQQHAPSGYFDHIDAGQYHNCGVRPDGSVTWWGDDGSEQSSPGNLTPTECLFLSKSSNYEFNLDYIFPR
jgi:hypothetical protein